MLVMVSKLLVIRVMNVDTEIFQIDVTAKETRTPAKGLFHDDLQEKRRDRSFFPFEFSTRSTDEERVGCFNTSVIYLENRLTAR